MVSALFLAEAVGCKPRFASGNLGMRPASLLTSLSLANQRARASMVGFDRLLRFARRLRPCLPYGRLQTTRYSNLHRRFSITLVPSRVQIPQQFYKKIKHPPQGGCFIFGGDGGI